MHDLSRNLRLGLRSLAGQPLTSLLAISTLALGIGASTAIFTIVWSVLLEPLPYREPERIVGFWGQGSWSAAELEFVRAHGDSYELVAAFADTELTLTGQDEPRAVEAVAASPALFEILGVEPALGRRFRAEEEDPGRGLVAVLSDGLWRRAFGADPEVVGRTVTLDDVPVEVVGVLPASFQFPATGSELFIPLTLDPSRGSYRGGHNLDLIARLRDGVSLKAARGELAQLVPQLKEELDLLDGFDKLASPPTVVPLREQIVAPARPALLVLPAAAVLLLLIVCANVASLLLTRAVARRRELAVRAALGATRTTLIGQLLVESGVLALLGGAGGLFVAAWLLDLAMLGLPPGSPRVAEIALDLRALLFCGGLVIVTLLLFGIAPALAASRRDDGEVLAAEGRSDAALGSGWGVRKGLVIAEVTLAALLVITGALLARSLLTLLRTDPGFSTDVLTFRVDLSSSDYSDRKRRVDFYDQLFARLTALPGVESTGGSSKLPIAQPGSYQILEIEGRPFADGDPPSIYWRALAGAYFTAMGIPLLEGRRFDIADDGDGEPVCIVNRTAAERFWPDGGALGNRIRNSMDGETWLTIVGVVGDVRHESLDRASELMIYRPLAQSPPWVRNLSIVVRSTREPETVAAAVRRETWAVDPEVPVFRFSTMQRILADSVSQRRLTAMLVGLFGVSALALALIGVFAVLSFAVGQRTGEIGVRMAMGARGRDILHLVLREGMALVLAGTVGGVAAALGLTRLLRTLLYGVSATDPLTFVLVPLALMAVALLACWLPGRRAVAIDPIVALRHE